MNIKQAINLESPYKFKFHELPHHKDSNIFKQKIETLKKTVESQKMEFAKDKKLNLIKVFKKKELGLIYETILYKNLAFNDQNSTMAKLNNCVIFYFFFKKKMKKLMFFLQKKL